MLKSVTQFKERPRGSLNKGGFKKSQFSSKYLAISWKRYQWLVWNVNKNRQVDPCQFRWHWVILKVGTRVASFSADLHTYTRTVWQTTIIIGAVTHVERGVSVMGQTGPCYKEQGPSAYQFWGYPKLGCAGAHALWHVTTNFGGVNTCGERRL